MEPPYVLINPTKCLVFFVYSIVICTRFGCYLHPSSGAQLQRTAIGVCVWFWCVIALEQVLVGTRDTLTLLARSVTPETFRANGKRNKEYKYI
jgi:hypothetical protein